MKMSTGELTENEKLTDTGELLPPVYASSNGSWKTPISGEIQSEIQSNSSLIAAPNSSSIVQQIDDDANSRHSIIKANNNDDYSIPALDEYPPPYPGSEQSTWPCDSFSNFHFENEMSCLKNAEVSKLINKSSPVPNVCMNISPSGKTQERYQKIMQINPDERNNEYYLQHRCEPDTFSHKYGTVCIVTFFVIFLMMISLAAKLLVNGVFKR